MSITTLRLDSFIGKKTYSLFDNSYLLALTCIDSLFFLPMKVSNLKVVILMTNLKAFSCCSSYSLFDNSFPLGQNFFIS